jgi:hypothetical protein
MFIKQPAARQQPRAGFDPHDDRGIARRPVDLADQPPVGHLRRAKSGHDGKHIAARGGIVPP